MSDLFSLAGRAIVVTGGAGHIGRHLCEGLAALGANVLCASSKAAEFEGSVESVVCDVSDRAAFDHAVKGFVDRHGRLDGLVNAAARAPRGIDAQMSERDFAAAIKGLLTVYMTATAVALPYMHGPGSIVNLVSMWGVVSPNPAVYRNLKNEPSLAAPAAAGGIIGMTRYIAIIGAAKNIRANCLVPGWFPKKRGEDRPDYIAEIVSRVPLGRIGQPQELVGPTAFLLSDAASYITGSQITVDGGFTSQ